MAENQGIVVPGEAVEGSLAPSVSEQQEVAVKERARSLGWKPLKEYDKDPADWVSAREFLSRQSFFDKIKEQRNEIRSLKTDIQLMGQHFSQMKEVEYKRALSTLKSDRKEATASGNIDKAESISDQITEIETQRKQTTTQTQPQQGAEEFEQFKQRNKWYNSDSDLTKRANAVGIGYANMNPQATPNEVLAYVEEAMRPSVQPKRVVAPASPEAGGINQAGRGSKNKLSEGDLSPMQQKIMNTLIQRGIKTKDEYLTELTQAESVKNASSLDTPKKKGEK
jgi:hypothetical protein